MKQVEATFYQNVLFVNFSDLLYATYILQIDIQYCYDIIYNNSLIMTKMVISGCSLKISHCNEIWSLFSNFSL